MDKIGTKKDPSRWLFELVENEGFIDLGEISSEHWIKRAYDHSSTEEKVTKLEKEELKQFISIIEGTFGLIKFRIDKKTIYTFSYLPLDNEKTIRQDGEDQGTVSHRFSQFAEQVPATTAAATTAAATTAAATTAAATTAAATTAATTTAEEEENQTKPIAQSITRIDEQQAVGNTGDAKQAIDQYIQELGTDPGIQQIIA
jgi:hypothetical protein